MQLQIIPGSFAVCRLAEDALLRATGDFWFLSRTDEELSLVCRSESIPESAQRTEDGWRMFRVCGALDFSLTGVLAELSRVLAEARISIFAVSTYDTDYILVKADQFARATAALRASGHTFKGELL